MLKNSSISSKDLIPLVAKKLNISEELAQDVINDYYSNIVRSIENMEQQRMMLPKLGNLVFSLPKMKRYVERMENDMANKSEDGESFKRIVIAKERALMCNLVKNKIKQFQVTHDKRYTNLEE